MTEDYIPNVTIDNVTTLSFTDMLIALKPYTQERIPEGVSHSAEAYTDIEQMIGRFANVYSYLIYLYAYVANSVNIAKRKGDTERKEALTRKKDALYELARAVRYKHEACSRMLTAALNYNESQVFERPDGKAREKQAETRRMHGWGEPL